jgi:osmotically-inducible protein OsmY
MKNDLQIQKDVEAELERAPKVPNGSVGVEVHHGTVKIAARNTDPTVTQQAELAARHVEGVTNVVLDTKVTHV